MKLRIVLPRRQERRISFLYGPPFPGESGWVWIDRRAKLERRTVHHGVERRVCRREESLFRTLFEISSDAAVLLDGRGAVVVANRQCERFFGYRREELIGEMIEMLLPERYRIPYAAWREAYAAQPRQARLDLELCCRDGTEIPVHLSLNPVETPQRQLVLAVARDITEQRRAIDALKREIKALAEAKAGLEADLLSKWL